MPSISYKQNELQIMLETSEKIWSLKGNFSIPFTNISEVHTSIPEFTWKELRAPGTFMPGLIKAGTYYSKRGKEFWYTTRFKKHALVLELQNETYKRIVLGFENMSTQSKYLTDIQSLITQ